jgi:hypothetical protein
MSMVERHGGFSLAVGSTIVASIMGSILAWLELLQNRCRRYSGKGWLYAIEVAPNKYALRSPGKRIIIDRDFIETRQSR